MCFSLKKLLKLKQILFLVLNYRLFMVFEMLWTFFRGPDPVRNADLGPRSGPGSGPAGLGPDRVRTFGL